MNRYMYLQISAYLYGEGGGGGALAVLRVTEVLSTVLGRHVQDGDRDHEGAGLVPADQS